MNFTEVLEKLKAKNEVLESKDEMGVLNVWVSAKTIKNVITFLKNDMQFDQLSFVTAVDLMINNHIEMVYRLFSYETKTEIVIKVKLDRVRPEIETISDIFSTANWHERETSEMFGVKFINHPDPNRLLLPDGVDMPLRKDFKSDDMIPLPKV
ncbi:MAG: NADH-quinone oxidoreductase subunit C [bacterium]